MQEAGILERLSQTARASRSEVGLLVFLGVAIVGAGLVVVLRTSDPPAPPVHRQPAVVAQASPPAAPKMVVVHVAGQVNHPGVYTLKEGSRITDAISAAGGPLEGADGNALNLAAVVADGQKIVLTKPGQAPPPDAVQAEAGTGAAGTPGAKVNLNTATQAQLEELPSVGPVLAQRIIVRRQTKGPFTSPRQLMEVSGVGPKKFEGMKDLVTVS